MSESSVVSGNDPRLTDLQEAVSFLRSEWGDPPEMALVLGSGLGDFVEEMPERQSLSYPHIPHFPGSTVVGHAGQLTLYRSEGVRVVAMQGRVHFYEGKPMWQVVMPVRTLALWGVSAFVITNAAGAINRSFAVGDLMLITDHINLLGDNPLTGDNLDRLGERFPDMSYAYDPALREQFGQTAADLSLELRDGVYVAVKGPSYETPAEIRMLRAMGADAVGMSTVPEVIALNHMKKRVVGISCITNMAAGVVDEEMKHEDVLRTTQRVRNDFARLLQTFAGRLGAG